MDSTGVSLSDMSPVILNNIYNTPSHHIISALEVLLVHKALYEFSFIIIIILYTVSLYINIGRV